MRRTRFLSLVALALLAGCAAEPQPAATQLAIVRPCQHPVSSQVQLAGALLTTSKCAD